jgi:hypothetical protein
LITPSSWGRLEKNACMAKIDCGVLRQSKPAIGSGEQSCLINLASTADGSGEDAEDEGKGEKVLHGSPFVLLDDIAIRLTACMSAIGVEPPLVHVVAGQTTRRFACARSRTAAAPTAAACSP